jgi:hypothetical protein
MFLVKLERVGLNNIPFCLKSLKHGDGRRSERNYQFNLNKSNLSDVQNMVKFADYKRQDINSGN